MAVLDASRPQSAWNPPLTAALASRTSNVARAVARRLRDDHSVGLAIAAAPAQTAYPRTVHWRPSTLAQGDAGLALTCAYLDRCFPDEGWDRTGHRYLASAAEAAEHLGHASAGLFSGVAGLGFAAWVLSRGATRYRRLLTTLDDALLPQVAHQAEGLTRLTTGGVSFGEFDVISGLTGAGAYLLCRRDTPRATAVLEVALRALIVVSGIGIPDDASDRPPWWTPADLLGDEEMTALYPHGNINCGLAHGIPGPLAFMALALSEGNAVAGLAAAIDRVVEWLIAYRADDAWGVNWPFAVPLMSSGLPDVARSAAEPSRAAWCYGAPGVARALWLAGVARDRPDWRNLAIEAMAAVYRRPVTTRRIDSPTFCHGVAGLLQITLRFASDTRLPMFSAAAAELTEWVLSAYEPDSLLGYRNWEPGGKRVDQAGLLDGAPGVLLTLLAASSDVEPTWDRAFLLS